VSAGGEPEGAAASPGPLLPPLADRLRPLDPADVFGQETVLGPGTLLAHAFATGEVPSLVLWGPPGSGKTTIARLLAARSGARFVLLSAVTSGVKDVREVIAAAKERRREGERTLLFVDEIHRFNRAQQDAFLPHVEDGTIVLVGATTENPGFSLVGALLSRLRVVVLRPLGGDALGRIADRALADPALAPAAGGRTISLAPAGRASLIGQAGGDARRLLNVLESAVSLAGRRGLEEVDAAAVAEAAQAPVVAYDRSGDDRYDLLSAFHKSLRGSDADAAIFWMTRMLEAGEDPLVICRRMVAMASEDVGLADPRALALALDAWRATEVLGLPEGRLALGQACLYLAAAPKSNTVLRALDAATRAARAHPEAPVPLHLRNAPTRLASELGHARGYEYPHDLPRSFSTQPYLPDAVTGLPFVEPREVGDEREFARRLQWWRKQRR
jgi:putative ATPase